jgi:hypothetical protein
MRQVTNRNRQQNHPGEERYVADSGDSDAIEPGTSEELEAPRRARGLGTDGPPEEKKDSGFFGVGDNEGDGDDNLARETEPGYQRDKWKRGTIMPR